MKSITFLFLCLSINNAIASTNLKKQAAEITVDQTPEEQTKIDASAENQVESEELPLSDLMKESGMKKLKEVIQEQFKLIAGEKAKDEEKEAFMKKTRDDEVSSLDEIIAAKLQKIREFQAKKRESLIEKYTNKLNYVDDWIKKEEEILNKQLDFLINQADETIELRLKQERLELKNRLDQEYSDAIIKYKDQMNDTQAILKEKLDSILEEDKENFEEMKKEHSMQIEISIEKSDSTLESVRESLGMSIEDSSAIRREEAEKFNVKAQAQGTD